jgi:tetratricopeptide (TPR) repeat protein
VSSQSTAPAEVFYSYSHTDEVLRDELDKHLSLLQRQNLISEWHDRQIEAGDDWESEINAHLDSARIILLLVSADFIASDYCYSIEMNRALERHDEDEARVIPIILRPVDWESSPLGRLQALPKGGKPVTLWDNQDEAFKNVAQGIRNVIREFKPKPKQLKDSARIPRPPVVGFVARRDAEGRDIVDLLKEKLAPGQTQLVTLSGPGGVGKTTLAAEAARELRDAYSGRLVWSETAARAGYTLPTLLDDVATQLGRADLRTLKPDEKEAAVRALVADPPALVVVDNCETIAPDGRRRIEEWFEGAQCSALFTSRQPIRKTFVVNILVMQRDEAEELLQKLIAQTQDPQIFSAEVRQHIYETAEANPFLIEWIVAQINEAQEPRAVLDELTHGEGDAAERVFTRSFNLPQVGDDGRAALLALSLFVPSASREALAEVAGFGADLKRLNEALKNLHALWLIKGLDGNSRFTVEGLTRNLAAARLSKDSRTDEFRQRFVTYFLRYTEAHTQPKPEDFDALEIEKDNLLSATDVAFTLDELVSVLSLTEVLGSVNAFLDLRGYWDDAIKYNSLAVTAAHKLGIELAAAVYSHRIGILQFKLGLYDGARQSGEKALSIYRHLNDERNISVALHELGHLAEIQEDFNEARRLFGESLEIDKRLGNQSDIAIDLHSLATIVHKQGKLEEARRLYEESLEINRKLGNQIVIAITLLNLAAIARAQGLLGEARRLYEESLEINRKLGSQDGIAITLHALGLLTEQEGNKDEAVRLISEALSIYERLGSPATNRVRRDLGRLKS